MQNADKDVHKLFAEAKAIYFTMQHGAITYQQAKLRTKPLLQQINDRVELIAKKHKVKPKYILFQDLGVTV